jgi:hypothetical protein
LQGRCQSRADNEFNLERANKPLKTRAKIDSTVTQAGKQFYKSPPLCRNPAAKLRGGSFRGSESATAAETLEINAETFNPQADLTLVKIARRCGHVAFTSFEFGHNHLVFQRGHNGFERAAGALLGRIFLPFDVPANEAHRIEIAGKNPLAWNRRRGGFNGVS